MRKIRNSVSTQLNLNVHEVFMWRLGHRLNVMFIQFCFFPLRSSEEKNIPHFFNTLTIFCKTVGLYQRWFNLIRKPKSLYQTPVKNYQLD